MATGFPTKANWVSGDILTAAQMDDLAGTVNLLNPTAKGGLVSASAANTPAVLAVGADGTTLVANSSAATGLSYQPLNSAGKNAIINGGMDIWQRGTSVALAASAGVTYLADRWCTTTGANQATTVSRQVTGDTTNLPNIQYCLRYQRNAGQTGLGTYSLIQNIETANSIPFVGKQVTLSGYIRAGANFSATSNLATLVLISGTGTDQSLITGFTGQTTVATTNATLTTTWQRFSVTGTVGATVTQLGIGTTFTPVGTAGANDYFEITGVQLELGSVATTFSRAGGTLQGELAACQRYYQRWSASIASTAFLMGLCDSTTVAAFTGTLSTTMRSAPSISGTNLVIYSAGAKTFGAITSRATSSVVSFYSTTTGLTAGAGCRLEDNTTGTGYLEMNSEL